MTVKVEQPLALACVFTWVGFVCAISFLEAWLKFKAPGVTLPIGLGIGRLVFNALNKIEWFFALIVVGSALYNEATLFSVQHFLLLAVLVILFAETVWLLPKLDARAELRITGKEVSDSYMHLYFIGAEMLKVGCLVILGDLLFRQ